MDHKGKNAVAIIIIIILSVAAIVFNGREETVANVSNETVINSETPEVSEEIKLPEFPEVELDWESAEVTKGNVKKALESTTDEPVIPLNEDSLEQITVFHTPMSMLLMDIVIDLHPNEYLNEKEYLRQLGTSMIVYSKILFANPKIDTVCLNGYFNNKDEEETFGAQLVWSRADVTSINFKSLLEEAQVDIAKPYHIGRTSIFPSLLNVLDSDDRLKLDN